MNAEQLLAHYERVVDAPDAVTRLRGFVLDIAVRGKLVPQFDKEESAEALLRLIASEKVRRVKAGEARQPKDPPSPDDPPCALPQSWRWSSMAEIGFISPRVEADDETQASFVPMPMIAAELGVAHQHEPRKWGDIKKGYTHFAEGDVGLAKITPCFENGKSTVFRNLTGGIGGGTTELHVVRPVLVSPDYVLVFFKSSHFIETGIPRMTGTAGQKRLPAEYFAHSPFPLPPLAEQHRIVAKVDELMALCDRLEAARAQREATRDRLTASTLARLNTPEPPASPDVDASKESSFQSDARFALKVLPALTARPDQIKQLRQTILNLAVQGKLVSQVSGDRPTGPLLERLKAAKQVAHEAEELRARLPPRPPSRSDLNFDFPMAWAVAAFDDLFVIVSGVTKGQKIPALESIEARYLRVANVQRGYLDLDVIKTISVRASDIRRYALRVGDILMTEGGDWDKLGRAAVWRDEIPGCIHQNHVFRVRPPSSEIVAEWVTTYVNSPLGRAFFEDASKQTTNLASINMTQLRSCPIPLPPTAEQHRIVAKVDELMSLCDQLEASLTRGENTRSRLLNALLHEALAPAESELEAA